MFWLAVGATVGVLVVRKVTTTAHAFTPAGLADRVAGVGDSLRCFADEVRAGMAERESELREALGIDRGGPGSEASGTGRGDPAAAHGARGDNAELERAGPGRPEAGRGSDGQHELSPAAAADVIERPTSPRRVGD